MVQDIANNNKTQMLSNNHHHHQPPPGEDGGDECVKLVVTSLNCGGMFVNFGLKKLPDSKSFALLISIL